MSKELDKEVTKKIVEMITKSTDIKSYGDMSVIFKELQSSMLQSLLNAEIDAFVSEDEANKKNGYSSKSKKLRTPTGVVEVDMPRDRKSEFEPVIVKKRQRVMDDFSDMCILLYSRGNTLEDIQEIIKKMYSIELSKGFISDLVSRVSEDVRKWHERPLKKVYAFMMIDCLYCNVKIEGLSTKTAVYVILGVGLDGKKEIVGIWISDGSEAASFWGNIFTDIKNRGVEDVLYIAMDGLAGLTEAIANIYPLAKVQRCVVHLGRNMYGICNKKQVKEVMKDYRKIYKASSLEEATEQYNIFIEKYKEKNTIIHKMEGHFELIKPLFEEDPLIRKMIYTTNAIESVNSALRKVTNGKGMFMNKESLSKVLYLRMTDLEKKWAKGIQNWKSILEVLVGQYGERITKHIIEEAK